MILATCSVSDLEASRSQDHLTTMVEQVLETNRALCKRMKNLEDTFDARSTLTRPTDNVSSLSYQSEETVRGNRWRLTTSQISSTLDWQTTRFSFDSDLQSSRVYRMARSEECDRSFDSSIVRTHAWSVFSGLSLADISVLAVIALPLCSNDIKTPGQYTFGLPESYRPPSGGRSVGRAVESVQYDRYFDDEDYDGYTLRRVPGQNRPLVLG